jgi:hypothetical protein
MKPRSRSKWQAASAGHAHNVKARADAVEWQRRLDALAEDHLTEPSIQAERITEHGLMVWFDDGGAAG